MSLYLESNDGFVHQPGRPFSIEDVEHQESNGQKHGGHHLKLSLESAKIHKSTT